MDELLLQELYGSQQVQAEQQVKQAQIELVEAVAAQAGVDLNELDDAELAKFAHYVLSDEDEPQYAAQDESLNKLAEADVVGRQMAHSYADELNRIQQGENMRHSAMNKVAHAMQDAADLWQMKIAEGDASAPAESTASGAAADSEGKLLAKLKRYMNRAGQETGILEKMYDETGKKQTGLNRAGRLAGTAAGLGALGYGGYRLMRRGDDASASEKVSMLKMASEEKTKEGEKFKDRMKRYGQATGKFTGVLETPGEKLLGKRGLRLGGTGAGLAAAGYGGYRLMRRNDEAEKISMFLDAGYEALAYATAHSPAEFAKEAEFRAAEILLANGIDPASLTDVYPENVKIASFPGVEDAVDYDEAEVLAHYNELLDAAALHIIDQLID